MLLVEQDTVRALNLANRAYVIELGRVVSEGKPEQLLTGWTPTRRLPRLRLLKVNANRTFSGMILKGRIDHEHARYWRC